MIILQPNIQPKILNGAVLVQVFGIIQYLRFLMVVLFQLAPLMEILLYKNTTQTVQRSGLPTQIAEMMAIKLILLLKLLTSKITLPATLLQERAECNMISVCLFGCVNTILKELLNGKKILGFLKTKTKVVQLNRLMMVDILLLVMRD